MYYHRQSQGRVVFGSFTWECLPNQDCDYDDDDITEGNNERNDSVVALRSSLFLIVMATIN